jgi:G3E family GTPase
MYDLKMKKVPVNIISGFLGSGKTTAIISLLEQKQVNERWAIVVNEFGKVSIDGQTLQSKSTSGSVFDISGGCICCSAKGYLRENLEKIIETGSFDRIIIEPSGLGGIEMVIEIVGALPELKIMPVICLVDITAIDNERLRMNRIYRMQITKAEIILFSKCDLLPEIELQDQLIDNFKTLFPEKLHCVLGKHLAPVLLDIDFREIETQNVQYIYSSDSNLTDKNFEEMNYQFGAEIQFYSEKLVAFFYDNPSIVRAKGHLSTETGWMLVNFTLSGCIFENCLPKDQGELVIIAEKSGENPFPDFQKKMKALLI